MSSTTTTTPVVEAVYGEPLDGAPVVRVPTDLAPLLAEAHRRVRGREAGVHAGDGVVTDPSGKRLQPTPAVDRWQPPSDDVVALLAGATRPVVLAGPGVVRESAVPGLHALAAAGSLGVLNTWGAKGIFDWRSRHHLATAGLQARDFELGGLAEADLIIATGLDEQEAAAPWRLAPVVEVSPCSLGPLAERWGRPPTDIEVPRLRAGLAGVTQAGWATTGAPLAPTKVTQHYGQQLGGGGLVVADPGTAGFWVARTLATTGIGGVIVPAAPDARGFALASAIVSGRFDPTRPVLAVLDGLDDQAERLLEVAASLSLRVAVEVWRDDAAPLDADGHRDRLAALLADGGIASVATDPSQLDEMIDVAGPVVAWRQPA